MRSLGRHRDPAPSRLSYRLQRLMLTPLVRVVLVWGLPVALVLGPAGVWLSDQDRRDRIAMAVADARRSIEERPEFQVRLMVVEGVSAEVGEDIREIVAIDFPISSFDLDLAAIRSQVQGLDPVAAAEVRVRAGGVLELRITEREPAVVWRSAEALELLDAGGHRVAQLAARADRADLPLVAGAGAETSLPEALAILAAAETIAPRVRGLLRVGERRWDVVLDRDQRILLPESDPVSALEHVLALHEAQDLLERNVTVVDMRLPHRPTLRLTGEAMGELRRIRSTDSGAD